MRKSKRKDHKKPSGKGMTFRDYNPASVSPLSQQFEPTTESPIRRSAKQAGVS